MKTTCRTKIDFLLFYLAIAIINGKYIMNINIIKLSIGAKIVWFIKQKRICIHNHLVQVVRQQQVDCEESK